MPSEKKSKKHKIEKPSTTSNEPMKPLAHYATDRLELTKQLFSCLKNKQIKQRLPQNLQVSLLLSLLDYYFHLILTYRTNLSNGFNKFV